MFLTHFPLTNTCTKFLSSPKNTNLCIMSSRVSNPKSSVSWKLFIRTLKASNWRPTSKPPTLWSRLQTCAEPRVAKDSTAFLDENELVKNFLKYIWYLWFILKGSVSKIQGFLFYFSKSKRCLLFSRRVELKYFLFGNNKIYISYLVIKEVITGFGYRNIVWCSHCKPHWINHRRWITTTAICTKAQFSNLATMVIKMSIHITRSDRLLRLLKVIRFTICKVFISD